MWFSRNDRKRMRRLAFRIYRMEHHMSQVDDTLNAIITQLGKARAEIVGLVSDLEGQIAASEAPKQETLDALRAAAQSLDDIVLDAVEEPVDEPPAA